MRNILIITYYFPPDPYIGARRWAKFAKFIHKRGHNVHVICAKNTFNKSPWDDDVQGIPVTRLPGLYPKILTREPVGLLEKLSYRLNLSLMKLVCNGTIYDRACLWKDQLIKTATEIIERKKIDLILVNGPPHRLMYYTCLLKDTFPGVEIYSDFRDPWTWWYNLGYPFLSKRRMAREQEMEKVVVDKSDRLFTPMREMSDYLKKKYPQAAPRISILPHGIDLEEIPAIEEKPMLGNQPLKLIYFGSLYLGLDQFYESLAEFLNKEKVANLDIYTADSNYKKFFDSSGFINTIKPVPAIELFRKTVDYDYFLLVFPEAFKNYFSSKFFELIALRVPVIYVGYPGETQEFIEKNQLGIFFDIRDLESFFSWLSSPAPVRYNRQYDLTQHSFDTLCKDVLEL
jgi:glycosyltransferase involved in cell wall biosynthesis